jgi:hypothetical protein
MTEGKLSRRDSLKGLALLGAGAVTATAVTSLTTQAEAAQVHMDIALETLNTALKQLQDAIPDKGGHRVKAIALVREAINQVELGIRAGR